MLKLENVQITVSSLDRPNITIQVRDKESSIDFLSIEMTPEQFADAFLHKSGHQPIKSVTLTGLEKIGKRMEHKALEIEVLGRAFGRSGHTHVDDDLKDLMAPHIPEGWQDDGSYKYHYVASTDTTKVRTTIRRWVEKQEQVKD